MMIFESPKAEFIKYDNKKKQSGKGGCTLFKPIPDLLAVTKFWSLRRSCGKHRIDEDIKTSGTDKMSNKLFRSRTSSDLINIKLGVQSVQNKNEDKESKTKTYSEKCSSQSISQVERLTRLKSTKNSLSSYDGVNEIVKKRASSKQSSCSNNSREKETADNLKNNRLESSDCDFTVNDPSLNKMRKYSDSSIKNICFDRRWSSLCRSKHEQVLIPCPTCGRKFCEEAAFRHFPICSRVKERITSKNDKEPLRQVSPAFISMHLGNESASDDRPEHSRERAKPVTCTFSKSHQPTNNKVQVNKIPRISKENADKSRLAPLNINESPRNNSDGKQLAVSRQSKGERHQISEGARKSASIWKKSTKEFVIKSYSKIPIKKPVSGGNDSVSANSSKTEVLYSTRQSWFDFRANWKKPLINENSSNAANHSYVDIIPQNLHCKKVNDETGNYTSGYFESFDSKLEKCLICNKYFYSTTIEGHTDLCQRIKHIEKIINVDAKQETDIDVYPLDNIDQQVTKNITEENPVGNRTIHLFKHGSQIPSDLRIKTITLKQCPCCSELVDVAILKTPE